MNVPDYRQLIEQANATFQEFAGSGVYTYNATAAPAGGGVAYQAGDLTQWTFLGKKIPGEDSWQVQWTNGSFGQPFPLELIPTLLIVKLPQGTVDLPQAITILNQNGYTSGFSEVAMGTTLVHNAPPMFWFRTGDQAQGVSASTGDFYPNCGGPFA